MVSGKHTTIVDKLWFSLPLGHTQPTMGLRGWHVLPPHKMNCAIIRLIVLYCFLINQNAALRIALQLLPTSTPFGWFWKERTQQHKTYIITICWVEFLLQQWVSQLRKKDNPSNPYRPHYLDSISVLIQAHIKTLVQLACPVPFPMATVLRPVTSHKNRGKP